jgi:Ku protein
MAPRAYWKGFLRLSLVTCPIELYPATSQSEKTHFHQINTQTGHRLRQQMVDETTGDVVDKKHKGRGYELSKGRYVEIDEDELAAVELESTHTLDIDSFVPLAEIDKRYLERPYYVAPDGKVGAEAFCVIRDAMKARGHTGLARIVMANREHVVALEPLGKGILATTLRYDYEVRDEQQYFSEVPGLRVSKEMRDLAEFHDEYEIALRKLVKRKAAGHKIEAQKPARDSGKVIDLMEALRRSIGERSHKGAAHGRGRGKKTAARRGKKAA